jgi:hypothetical protein
MEIDELSEPLSVRMLLRTRMSALRQFASQGEYMPLLRSLADRAARAAINMALLTELFALHFLLCSERLW